MRNSGGSTEAKSKGKCAGKALKGLNDYLSERLPLLREIEYYGVCSLLNYGRAPIEALIKERQHGDIPLRAVRIKADCWPKITDIYDKGGFEIEGRDRTYLFPTPRIVADLLATLKVNPCADNLSSLTLEGEYGLHNVEHMLRLFPNLQELDVCATNGFLSASGNKSSCCHLVSY
ncbi:hypothetical protein GGI10_002503 [Coemansia sp. RSA 2530]|nr:hypothetical protein GGI10_002503 [Coemansia sp. RSA 2530]